MTERGKWAGMLAIARFNWPLYATAGGGLLLGLAALVAGGWLAPAGGLAGLVCGYFLFGSLGVSYWVYDRSDLYRWSWLERAMGDARRGKLVICHCGFDEISEMLERRLPAARWQVLDHYDRQTMTESSIRRAREFHPPRAGTVPARFDRWPVTDRSVDGVLGMLALHELRSAGERAAWFAEARRCLTDHGRVVVVEHVRDAANFVAFGPGFLHFHSVAAWRRSWQAGGFRLADGFRLTPFVRVFVLKPS